MLVPTLFSKAQIIDQTDVRRANENEQIETPISVILYDVLTCSLNIKIVFYL